MASFKRDAECKSSRHVPLEPLPRTPLGKLKFWAGQPDPTDESHFTIDFETHKRRGTIDGWLMPDDTLKLQLRE
jgi:hypothetical protein